MPTTVIVLGAGLVGSIVADDLARSPGLHVTVADADQPRLDATLARTGPQLQTLHADLGAAEAIERTVAPFDLVVGALPGWLGLTALRAVISAGKPYCDISFMPEDFLAEDEAAIRAGVTAVVDCGVAPGLSNMLAARALDLLDRSDRLDIYVGGLPKTPTPPFNYKAAFSPADVIEEYTRPARLVENGRVVVREALSEIEHLDLPRPGRLEAFNSDGLRSLLHLPIPNMREKTLRYPGHAAQMSILRDAGFFDTEPLHVAGATVRPRDVAAALLFPKWSYQPGEPDLTVMRVIAEGARAGRDVRLTWDLYDEYDQQRDASSMARTTGYVCSSITRAIADGRMSQPGVIPPEVLGRDLFDSVAADLADRGIALHHEEQPL